MVPKYFCRLLAGSKRIKLIDKGDLYDHFNHLIASPMRLDISMSHKMMQQEVHEEYLQRIFDKNP